MDKNIEKRLALLEEKVQKIEAKLTSSENMDAAPEPKKKMSVNEFLMTKKLDDDVKRTLAVAYWLDHHEKVGSFNTDDIKQWFRLAKFPIPKNVNDKINMNIKNGHVAEEREKKDSKKAWYITSTGVAFLENDLNK